MNTPFVREFQSREALASDLGDRICEVLQEGLEARGAATLVVSGGRTPDLLFDELSRADLDWARVEILLADERWVPDDDGRSNARLIRGKLLRVKAADAGFEPLWQQVGTAAEAAARLDTKVGNSLAPFDAVVLGMGEDGHTASLFPDAPEIQLALSDQAPGAMVLSPPSQPELRISLSPVALTNCRFLALHIEGSKKWDVLHRALGEGDAGELPVRTILRTDKTVPEVYWSP